MDALKDANAPESEVSADFSFELQIVKVLDSTMAYVDTAQDPKGEVSLTVVLLHGNPTSSYLYRNVIPHISATARCVAPDLIGMGQSGKPNTDYRFGDHIRYLNAFLDSVVPSGKVLVVVQDWGSALGFDWAYRHQSRIVGLVFMEFVRPSTDWDDFLEGDVQALFRSFRDPEVGPKLIIDQNVFVEGVLPAGTVRPLLPQEMDYYRSPYLETPSRRPLYVWPNEIPIAGTPRDVHEIVERYHEWLLTNDIPKLFFWATPGALIKVQDAQTYIKKLKNLTSVFLGEGIHYLQEDHPHRIGREVADWVHQLEGARSGNIPVSR